MADKDFLSQFSNDNKKPDSFKEEVRVPVSNTKKPFNPMVLIVPVVILVLVAIIGWFLFLRPSINVVNFVDSKQEDVVAWIRQQGIETSGIIFKEEYNFDKAAGVVVDQDVVSGKVTKKAKLTFTVSKGADPSEKVSVPDNLKELTRNEIETWISRNKLANTKINVAYDEEVPEGSVISVEFSGCDADTFLRGSTLKVSISKGPKPVDKVTVENFVKKTIGEMETWANQKGIKLTKSEVYSDTIEAGYVTYQSVAANEKVEPGTTIKVNVSKGKAYKMPNIVGKDYDTASSLVADVGLAVTATYKYSSEAKGIVLSQSIEKDKIVNELKKVEIVVSLGNKVDGSELDLTNLGKLKESIAELNAQGASLSVSVNEQKVYSADKHKDDIMTYEIKSGSTTYQSDDKLPLDTKIYVTVSAGMIYEFDLTGTTDAVKATESDPAVPATKFITYKVVDFFSAKGVSFVNNTSTDDCVVKINGVVIDFNHCDAVEYKEGQSIVIEAVPEQENN